jgi:hypothetical protein
LTTTAGDLDLRIPKLRTGSFFPSLLERRRRVDQALFAVVMEAYLHGVSTRKVDDLVKALGADTGISRSEVSRICAGLDEEVAAFRDRSLTGAAFPYVFLDATYCKARVGRRVVSQAVVIATGVRADGHREVLGFDVGDSEDGAFWTVEVPAVADPVRQAAGAARRDGVHEVDAAAVVEHHRLAGLGVHRRDEQRARRPPRAREPRRHRGAPSRLPGAVRRRVPLEGESAQPAPHVRGVAHGRREGRDAVDVGLDLRRRRSRRARAGRGARAGWRGSHGWRVQLAGAGGRELRRDCGAGGRPDGDVRLPDLEPGVGEAGEDADQPRVAGGPAAAEDEGAPARRGGARRGRVGGRGRCGGGSSRRGHEGRLSECLAGAPGGERLSRACVPRGEHPMRVPRSPGSPPWSVAWSVAVPAP